MTCRRCNHTTVKKFGTYGKRKVQRYRCHHCSATFSDTSPKVGNHLISMDRAEKIIALLVEGMSIRGIARVTGADQNTIMSLLLTVGGKCRRLFDAKVRGIEAHYMELDELWCFVFKKEKDSKPTTRKSGATPTPGSAWTRKRN